MIDAPLVWAFTAGLVATVNPCGFAMLPAYLSYFVGSEATADRPKAGRGSSTGRALSTGLVVSAGFLIVFGLVGAIVSYGTRSVIGYVPWIALVIGAMMALLGVAMIAGYKPSLEFRRGRRSRSPKRGLRSMFVFGISYAIASLSCTLPVFLAVVAGTITSSNFASGLVTFLAYGVGMSLVLIALTLSIAFAKDAIIERLHGARRWVGRASGVLLLVAGAYIVYYWTLVLSTKPGTNRASGPAETVGQFSGKLSTWLGKHPLTVGLALTAVVLVALVYVLARRSRPPTKATPATSAADTTGAEDWAGEPAPASPSVEMAQARAGGKPTQ